MKQITIYQSDDGLETFSTKEECEKYQQMEKVYVITHFKYLGKESIEYIYKDKQKATEKLDQLQHDLTLHMITNGVTCESYKMQAIKIND